MKSMYRSYLQRAVLSVAFLGLASTAMATDLRIGLQDDADVLDPHRARTFVGRIVFTSLCDKLFDINEKLEIQPQLATEWNWSEDGKVLHVKLRSDGKFHDGSPIKATDVKAISNGQNPCPSRCGKAK